MRPGYELIIPAREDVRATARQLLDAADDPSQVMTHRGGTEFSVPADVAERWRASLSPKPRGRSKKEG
jgi:hypothetical protein